MGMIRIYERAGKQKRKPGWQEAAKQEAEWLSKINKMKLAGGKTPVTAKASANVRRPKSPAVDQPIAVNRANYVIDTGTRRVYRPELEFGSNPEMLARELAAREVKHNSAPAFNKGGMQYVSENELVNTLSSNRRR